MRRTSYLTRNVQRWGKLPLALLNGLDLRRFKYGFIGTDEASLVERSGHPVAVVMGSPRNIKITTPADLELAEFYAGPLYHGDAKKNRVIG